MAEQWQLGYLGTYSSDRQPALESLLISPAKEWPEGRFAVAGPLYPPEIFWPENVMRVFHWAKRLYVFGLFEYGFFTVSCHYAYLAVESAVYNRWNAALPMPTVLQCGIDSMTVPTPGRGNISLICKTKGWKERQVKVKAGRILGK